MGTQQIVGNGPRTYVYPGQSPDGGKLIIRASSAAEANAIYEFIHPGQNAAALAQQGFGGLGQTPYSGGQEQPPYQPPPEDPGFPDDGSGSGSGFARPRYDPNADPSFQNLLSQLGLKETLSRNQAAQKIESLNTQLGVLLPRIAESGVEQRRGINFGAEARGVFRSGERLRNLALQQRGEQQRVADAQSALARQVAGVNSDLDTTIQQIAQERAQAQLEASMRAAGV